MNLFRRRPRWFYVYNRESGLLGAVDLDSVRAVDVVNDGEVDGVPTYAITLLLDSTPALTWTGVSFDHTARLIVELGLAEGMSKLVLDREA